MADQLYTTNEVSVEKYNYQGLEFIVGKPFSTQQFINRNLKDEMSEYDDIKQILRALSWNELVVYEDHHNKQIEILVELSETDIGTAWVRRINIYDTYDDLSPIDWEEWEGE